MRSGSLLTLAGVVLVGLLSFGAGYWFKGSTAEQLKCPVPAVTSTPTPSETPTATPSGKLTKTPTPTPLSSANIRVATPHRNDLVSSPFVLSGQARVFENVLNYRLLDSAGKVLTNGRVMATGDSSTFSPFSTTVRFTTSASNGTLEVYSLSAKDGSEINMIRIPLRFE